MNKLKLISFFTEEHVALRGTGKLNDSYKALKKAEVLIEKIETSVDKIKRNYSKNLE